ncbi:maleylpyruvate isomerase N-terminal domain-containing protein [Dactylosporangium sp. CS-033363]|uniref:maleylpyruvate isomerase N-terminal domain-containing protein n=1 Tax=Dactylosporangium sp. CS-033363 TaxID=3239935 RepID=UPI003D8E94F5
MSLFARSWSDLLAAVDNLPDAVFAEPSGCARWLIRDLVCHLVIDAQDVLITLATPAAGEPTRDAATYWNMLDAQPSGDDPLDALTVRLAGAYGDPGLQKFHLDDVGEAAVRAAELADPDALIATRGEILTVRDFLGAYVLEATLHHLDLRTTPPWPEGLARSRAILESIAGKPFPASWSDTDALLIGTGRRAMPGFRPIYLG